MYLLQFSDQLFRDANAVSFFFSILVSGLFYLEYRRSMRELEKEEMLDNFLNDRF